MARNRRTTQQKEVQDYRHDTATRKKNPPTGADKVAAWFIDSDYDGRTFCITQAFFPDKSAWNKIARVLKVLSTKTNLKNSAKVIDPRGNEVMRVHNLKNRY